MRCFYELAFIIKQHHVRVLFERVHAPYLPAHGSARHTTHDVRKNKEKGALEVHHYVQSTPHVDQFKPPNPPSDTLPAWPVCSFAAFPVTASGHPPRITLTPQSGQHPEVQKRDLGASQPSLQHSRTRSGLHIAWRSKHVIILTPPQIHAMHTTLQTVKNTNEPLSQPTILGHAALSGYGCCMQHTSSGAVDRICWQQEGVKRLKITWASCTSGQYRKDRPATVFTGP